MTGVDPFLSGLSRVSSVAKKLHDLWRRYCAFQTDEDALTCFSQYEILFRVLQNGENLLEFEIGGIPLYVRFYHNFTKGFLEYGVICSWNREARLFKALATFSFDKLGNLERDILMPDKAEAFAFHLKTVETIVSKAVALHNSSTETEE